MAGMRSCKVKALHNRSSTSFALAQELNRAKNGQSSLAATYARLKTSLRAALNCRTNAQHILRKGRAGTTETDPRLKARTWLVFPRSFSTF